MYLLAFICVHLRTKFLKIPFAKSVSNVKSRAPQGFQSDGRSHCQTACAKAPSKDQNTSLACLWLRLRRCAKSYIQQVCAPWRALNTKPPGATLSLLRLGTGLGLLPKPFIASQFTLRNSGILIFSGCLTTPPERYAPPGPDRPQNRHRSRCTAPDRAAAARFRPPPA
jgi:hypothetical protein